MPDPLRMGVIIATKGRPEMAARVIARLAEQTTPPETIVVSVADRADAPQAPHAIIADSGPGTCAQRNAGLAALPASIGVAVFFDDDFVPSRFWLEHLRDLFTSAPDIVAATGHVLADGIKSPGLRWDEAAALVDREDRAADHEPPLVRNGVPPYGCNMAYRRSLIRDLKFDERLVLYGWQEDTDFGARVAARGRCVWSSALWGVHLGVKSGRNPGRKLGYSQMVNPRYLVAKGTMRLPRAIALAGRNLAANATRALFAEPYIDRPGRLAGNLIGLWDIVTGRWRPERAAEL